MATDFGFENVDEMLQNYDMGDLKVEALSTIVGNFLFDNAEVTEVEAPEDDLTFNLNDYLDDPDTESKEDISDGELEVDFADESTTESTVESATENVTEAAE